MTSYKRFRTRVVNIGDVPVGGTYPVRVQSMTNTDTMDTSSTVEQVIRLKEAGCELVRISVPGLKEAENLKNIRKQLKKAGCNVPLIADVHFNSKIAEIAATIVEKVRVNPGNYADKQAVTRRRSFHASEYSAELERIATRIQPLLRICRENGTAIRIGTNHGSLSPRILERFGDTPEGMVESALEYARICRDQGFNNLVLSIKSSSTRLMIQANRLLVRQMKKEQLDFPLHLGVTEAGDGEDGRIRSAIGIGSLLVNGIGNTIRVSLTEDPVNEIPVAYNILQSVGVRVTRTTFIACPSCARTHFDIQQVLQQVKAAMSHLPGLKIAVMGCVVNGPGEMADADYGYVGGVGGKVNLYRKQKLERKNIPEKEALQELIQLIREGGDWKADH
ncbi:MAG: (E)-4-hydroxy-3-methylbut-2-enyl-diphosphate synthase [Bacteroidetes bacterium]|nr:(E)-4-hydroxy-3-methylbut-2-enyl-diphosphate synthase [Bacteroidota bacterium]